MSRHFPVVVHHNPRCGTSRTVLSMVEAAGLAATVIPYLETGWSEAQLLGLFAAMGVRPREVLREKEPVAAELGLLEAQVPDAAILAAMVAHPVLVNRPIVVTPLGVRLCRPAELALPLLAEATPTATAG